MNRITNRVICQNKKMTKNDFSVDVRGRKFPYNMIKTGKITLNRQLRKPDQVEMNNFFLISNIGVYMNV